MADDLQYASNKRKFDDQGAAPPPPTRRASGFSAPLTSPPPEISAAAAPPPAPYNSAPPLVDEIQLAKQRAQAIAAKLFSSAAANRPNADNGDDLGVSADHSLKSSGQSTVSHVGMTPPSSIPMYGYQGPSKKIEIPNGRVGVIIGKGGETIKYLQSQSGAKIQVTRDMDADPHSQTRMVELVGNSEQINKAEQLINEVLSEADAGGSGVISTRKVGNMPIGADNFVMKVPNNKVGLIIGKGGETIKNMQAKSGARIQIIPLHPPPGDTSQERTVQIDGTPEQVEAAKQLVNEVTSGENRMRNPHMSGGYSQQGYHQPRPQTWGTPGPPQMQQPGYGYMQPGAYPAQPPQYNVVQPPYGGYQSSYPDQSSTQQTQQPATGAGYDYYNQQQPMQQQSAGGSAVPAEGNSYNYSQLPPNYSAQGSYSDPAYAQPAVGQQQGYGQDSYSGSYTQPASTPQAGYDHQQGYGSTAGYPPQDGSAPTYGTSGTPAQVPPQQAPQPVATQQGYNGQPPSSAAASYPTQPGYGSQVPAGGYTQSPSLAPTYGQPPQGQKPPTQLPPTSQTGYVQPGYAQPPSAQLGYAQAPAPSAYGSTGPQQGYGQQSSYGSMQPQAQPSYGASAYSQPPAYSTENAAHGAYDPPSASPAVPTGVTKASPQG